MLERDHKPVILDPIAASEYIYTFLSSLVDFFSNKTLTLEKQNGPPVTYV